MESIDVVRSSIIFNVTVGCILSSAYWGMWCCSAMVELSSYMSSVLTLTNGRWVGRNGGLLGRLNGGRELNRRDDWFGLWLNGGERCWGDDD